MSPSRKVTGFTLIEVLMAMAVLALAGISMLGLSSENTRNSVIIEEKMLASWVADNKLVAIRLLKKWPPTHWQKEEQELAGRTWYIRSRSVKTTQDDFRGIDVEVRKSPNTKSPPLVTMQTYMVQG